MKFMFKRAVGVLALAVAASTMVVAPAEAVTKLSSVVKYCRDFPHDGYGNALSYSDHYAKCAQVYTTTNLTVRSGPGTTYAALYQLNAGEVYEFECWTYGQTVDGNNVWLWVYSAFGPRYVSDRYVYTGPNVKTLLPQC